MRAESSRANHLNRIKSVDALRGLAMMLIIFAHTRMLIDQSITSPLSYTLLFYATNISTVTFTFVNGTMLSYFFVTSKDSKATYLRFARRAALLLACHPLIKILSFPAHRDEFAFWTFFWVDFPITDTIACCLLTTPLICRYCRGTSRLWIIVTTLVLSPAVSLFSDSGHPTLRAMIEFLFGSLWWARDPLTIPFPLLPWIAIDLCGSFMGEALAKYRRGQLSHVELNSRFGRYAKSLALLSAALIATYKLCKVSLAKNIPAVVFEVYYPSKTTALLPLYLSILFVTLTKLFERIDINGDHSAITKFPAVFGRTSLFSYITHFVVAVSLPAILGFKGNLNVHQFFLAAIWNVCMTWVCAVWYGYWRGWIRIEDLPIRSVAQGTTSSFISACCIGPSASPCAGVDRPASVVPPTRLAGGRRNEFWHGSE